MDQRSDEWFQARLGKVTASRIIDVMAQVKTGEAAARKNYKTELVVERLTGNKAEGLTTADMQWGVDLEDQAKRFYELLTEQTVTDCGFIEHPFMKDSGASPDGFISEMGLIEIKCPKTTTHIDTLLGKPIKREYILQMQWQMACTNREWCDFISFDPRIGHDLSMYTKRIQRDEKMISKIEEAVLYFLDEVSEVTKKLKAMSYVEGGGEL